ncbi:glycosyltransferase family 4 protein [Stutzerimonas tarimensis]|uniref:Glycosyltransferase family 4 protein n=1 Tax=Stutzerimonas tarimensis TaxID=1507735 RepID=A0ABV7T3N1_9GAMM
MIAVNARFLTQELRGVQRFAKQICLELQAMRDDLVFLVPSRGRLSPGAAGLRTRRIGVNGGHLWEQLDLPLWLARQGKPLLLSLGNTAPAYYRNQIATHHDITYVRHPESYSATFALAYRHLTPRILKRARALITVSEFSRQEIAEYYGYPAEHINVVPNAVASSFCSASPASRAERPYLLAVSSINAHKNFGRMAQAFLLLEDCEDVELRIVGDCHAAFSATAAGIEHPRVRWLGRLSDDELADQYRGATAFVFPSLYEGFGIPPLEAQACGCPVIAAHSASIPEVLADSALLFNPFDVQEMALCMRRVLREQGLRDELVTRGKRNLARYSWRASADRVSRLIDSVEASRPALDLRFEEG